jgi:hypothetical protein
MKQPLPQTIRALEWCHFLGYHVIWRKCIYVSEERTASVFRTEEYANQAVSTGCWAYYWTLNVEAVRSSETLLSFYNTTPRQIPEDTTLHSQSRETISNFEKLLFVMLICTSDLAVVLFFQFYVFITSFFFNFMYFSYEAFEMNS